VSATQALCSGEKGNSAGSSAAFAGAPFAAGAGCAAADTDTTAKTAAASSSRAAVKVGRTTKKLGLDAHRPPDLVRSTGGTSI
jgi:hypothetical protein